MFSKMTRWRIFLALYCLLGGVVGSGVCAHAHSYPVLLIFADSC